MNIHATHLSTACLLLEIGSTRIVTDPVFDQGQVRYRLGPAAYATRYVGPAIDLEQLPAIDVALLSHAHHFDNLDARGGELISRVPQVITGRKSSQRAGERATRLAVWESTTVTGHDGVAITITAVPARHGPRWLPGSRHVVGFVLQWPAQTSGALYISGDTVWFGGLRRIAKRFDVDVAVLHLGGVHFWPPWPSFVKLTMTGRQAAKYATVLNPRTIVPIHYEQSIWSHFRESLESYRNEFADAGLTSRIKWLRHGERTEIRSEP
ncbi:MAG: MBL fold metallo-hydrolase [Pirellulales bacterium]|nr:MBL fold metallo-hydrolase [Pirellulales bacterium]